VIFPFKKISLFLLETSVMTKLYLFTRLGHIIKKLKRVDQNSIYKEKNSWLDVKSQKLKNELILLNLSQSSLLKSNQKVRDIGSRC
ncbi:hypothetical protein JRA57_003420, partial [Acinetobacter baumannii]